MGRYLKKEQFIKRVNDSLEKKTTASHNEIIVPYGSYCFTSYLLNKDTIIFQSSGVLQVVENLLYLLSKTNVKKIVLDLHENNAVKFLENQFINTYSKKDFNEAIKIHPYKSTNGSKMSIIHIDVKKLNKKHLKQ